jgi:hypothetical protein
MSSDGEKTKALDEALAELPLPEEAAKKAKEETGSLAIDATELVLDVTTGQTAHAVAGAASAIGGLFGAIAGLFTSTNE